MDYDTNNTYECKIGKYICTAFKDLMFQYAGKDYFINASEEEVKKGLERYHQKPDHIPSPFIALLLEAGKEKILIDTGIGFSKDPVVFRGNTFLFKGRLMKYLEEKNINKNEISQVVLSHFHPDHIGGVYDADGEINFPNAKYHMHEEEWNYWHSPGSDHQPPIFRHLVEKNVSCLKDRDLKLIKGKEQEILPGITAIQIPGHTPGQIALRIASENDKMLYISDAFLHPLHIEHINWQTNYDLNHDQAKASRRNMLELAYSEDMEIMAFHFDFPGLGKVDKVENNWKWKYK